MKRIAHRGFAGKYPENTLAAVQQAATRADMIELDLRRCRSGEIVVVHDGIVDAVTDACGRVNDLSATDLGHQVREDDNRSLAPSDTASLTGRMLRLPRRIDVVSPIVGTAYSLIGS